AILEKFSDFKYMTPTQMQLFSALSAGRSVIMNAAPASGKSFIVASWLLSQERAKRIVPSKVKKGEEQKYAVYQTTTAIVLVNSKEQGEQFKNWIKYIMSPTDDPLPEHAICPVVQVLTGGTEEVKKEQERLLRKFLNPHILVGNARRFLDLLDSRPELLDLD